MKAVARCVSFLLRLVRVILWLFMRLFILSIYRNKKGQLPPIESSILLQPATVIAKRIRQRQLTAREVIRVHVDRIRAIQPYLNVYIDERFEEALREAENIDRILDDAKPIPEHMKEENAPFLGVPFSIKESMRFPGFHNSTGIAERRHFIADDIAQSVDHMIKAGAILLCNTNVSEACMWFESYNSLYGTTNNPYDLTRTVGGSSGGAGCIVSAAGVPFAVGADIGGSIRLPSFMNGIFGHKTSPGIDDNNPIDLFMLFRRFSRLNLDIVPNDGQHPPHKEHHQKYLLSTGPMCRYATDLTPMLRVLAGPANLEKLININSPVDLSQLKYFYVDQMDAFFLNKIDAQQKSAHRRVVQHFEDKYKVHVTRLRFNRLENPVLLWAAMMIDGHSSSTDFSMVLSDYKYRKRGLIEVAKKLVNRSTHTIPSIGLLLLESIPNKNNRRLKNLAHKVSEEIQSLLGDNGVLFFPTFPQSAPLHGWPVIMNTFDYIYCGIFNALGLPSTQCPLGLDSDGLPLGIQCVAARGHDRLTLAVAQDIEHSVGKWVSPSVISCR